LLSTASTMELNDCCFSSREEHESIINDNGSLCVILRKWSSLRLDKLLSTVCMRCSARLRNSTSQFARSFAGALLWILHETWWHSSFTTTYGLSTRPLRDSCSSPPTPFLSWHQKAPGYGVFMYNNVSNHHFRHWAFVFLIAAPESMPSRLYDLYVQCMQHAMS